MQVAGIHNVLTKSLGTSNPHNVVKATFAALLELEGRSAGCGNALQDRRRNQRQAAKKPRERAD